MLVKADASLAFTAVVVVKTVSSNAVTVPHLHCKIVSFILTSTVTVNATLDGSSHPSKLI